MHRAVHNLIFAAGCLALLVGLQSSADAGFMESDAFPALTTVESSALQSATSTAGSGEKELEPFSIPWWQAPDGVARASTGAGVGSRAVDGPSSSSPQVAIATLIPELAAEASTLLQPEETRLHDRFDPSRLFRPPRCAVHHV